MFTRRVGALGSTFAAVVLAALLAPFDAVHGQPPTTSPSPACVTDRVLPVTYAQIASPAAGADHVLAATSRLCAGTAEVRIEAVHLGPSRELEPQTEHWYFQDVLIEALVGTSIAQSSLIQSTAHGTTYHRSRREGLVVEGQLWATITSPSETLTVRLHLGNATDGSPTVHSGVVRIHVSQ